MPKEIIPLARPDIQNSDIKKVIRVLKSGMLVQGKEVKSLETAISQMIGNEYCSAVSSGTASLHLALIALGIGKGDEVIVPALSFVATANVVELVGAKCVFIDTHPRYFNIDELKIEKAITDRTKAIIPVHEFGLCANMPAIMKLADKYNLKVIEDAACALGATWHSKYAGSFGHFGSFSLHPRKTITSGEGGLLVTSIPEFDKAIKTLRNHGLEPNSSPVNYVTFGFNYRMTDFQAALAHSQLMRLPNNIEYRNRLASVYFAEIANPVVRLPKIPVGAKHTWQTFHILLDEPEQRDKLINYLKDAGVLTNYGAPCIPATKYYFEKYKHDYKKEFPFAYESWTCGLAIPLYERLSEEQVKYISNLINKF